MKYHMSQGLYRTKELMGTVREYQTDTSHKKRGNYTAHVNAPLHFYCIVNLADTN